MKSKNIDVVTSMRGIGPVLAISCKGTVGAHRNLTNRMEEAIGDCTNIHAAYPALVYGFRILNPRERGADRRLYRFRVHHLLPQ
jgi:hypothetical protein